MKRLSVAIITIVICIGITAQAPQGFNYQAILRNSDGTIKANEPVALQISIVDEMGASAYLEVHNVTTNEFGLVNVVVGQGSTSTKSVRIRSFSYAIFRVENAWNSAAIPSPSILATSSSEGSMRTALETGCLRSRWPSCRQPRSWPSPTRKTCADSNWTAV